MPTDAAQWCELGTPNASDALRACGKAFQAMDAGIKPLAPTMRVAGRAFTVRCYPGATWAMEQAFEEAQPGEVLVVDGGGAPDVILMGALMSTRMQARGIAGAIVDAAVRDVDDIIALGFPVFSRHVAPRAGTFDEIGELQQIVCCGRIPVRPGDWVVGDRNGVVVVPAELHDDVLEKAREIHAREAALANALKKGKSFPEAIKSVDGSA
jgi:4-hydroxy-4-methyl-2-oxoglutarate aldolase